MKIHGVALSPPTQAVLLSAWALESDFEVVPVDILKQEHKTPEFLAKKNPRGQTPVLEDGDLFVAESLAIVRYMISKKGETSLYPSCIKA